MTNPRVAWFSPLQPVESGISLYSEEILPLLASVVDIDVIIDDYAPSALPVSPGLRVQSFRSFDPGSYDAVIYQIGNSPAHLYMLDAMQRTPGVMVLHDTMLNHLFIQQAVRNGKLAEYRDEMAARYGPPGEYAADRVLKGQAPDDLFHFPMSEPLIQQSTATIVHSNYALHQALDWVPDAAVYRVPHGLRMPQYVERGAARRALGLPDDQFIAASISHINPYKRIDVVLRALKQLRRSVPARLILAGSVSPNYPLGRMVSHLGLEQVVDLPGYVSDQEARLIAAAADVIVNLRYPTAGETSGSLLHSLAAGRPVIVSQTGSFSEVPDDAVIRIPVDAIEEKMLVGVLQRLAVDPALRNQIGERARAFIVEEHSLNRWAEGYTEVLESLLGEPLARPSRNDSELIVSSERLVQVCDHVDELTKSLASDMAELGLGGDEVLLGDVARARVELGLGVGMMSDTIEAEVNGSGDSDDSGAEETD
jgi:glycosyltransferase involved in cell wall biosynthesis